MSHSIYSIYKRTLVRHYGSLYHPNWHPTSRQELGDFGTLVNGQFTRVGNVRDLGIRLIASKPQMTAHQTFSSGEEVHFTFDAGGTAQLPAASTAKAKLTVTFRGGQGVSIQAYSLHHLQIQNYQAVTTAILQQHEARRWNNRWVVVTELHRAQKCLLAISTEGAQEAEIEFEAQQGLPLAQTTLANANLGLVCKSQHNIGYTVDTQQGEVTLGVSYGMVQVPLLRKPRVHPFENKGRWGSDGPTTKFLTLPTTAAMHTPQAVEIGQPRFVQVRVPL